MFASSTAAKVVAGQYSAGNEWNGEFAAKFNSATEAARKELGIAGTAANFSPTRDVPA